MKNLLLVIFLVPFISNAQPSIPKEQWFDFWIGEWDLTWTDADGTRAQGRNIISRRFNNFVIHENFEAFSGQLEGFIGMSVSVYNKNQDKWFQTWVDNQGSYLDFLGEFENGKRMFTRKVTSLQGENVVQRMVFYDIREDSFIWDWENSKDDGETWILSWRINYSRNNR